MCGAPGIARAHCNVLTPARFRQQHSKADDGVGVRVPVVIEGLMEGWPAMTRWQFDALRKDRGGDVVQVGEDPSTDEGTSIWGETLSLDLTKINAAGLSNPPAHPPPKRETPVKHILTTPHTYVYPLPATTTVPPIFLSARTTPKRNVVLGPIPSLGYVCVRAWMLFAGLALNELWPLLFGGDGAGVDERGGKDPLTKKAAKKASKKNK